MFLLLGRGWQGLIAVGIPRLCCCMGWKMILQNTILLGGYMLGKSTSGPLLKCLDCWVAFSFLILLSSPFLSFQIFNPVQPQIIQVSFRYYNKYTISCLLAVAPYLNLYVHSIYISYICSHNHIYYVYHTHVRV